MPETPIFKLPWPDGAEPNDVELWMQRLAEAVEAQIDRMTPFGMAFPYWLPGPAPVGFIFLNGAVASAITYPKLAAIVGNVTNNTFVLPNWTGHTARGLSPGETIGTAIGSDEIDLEEAHLPPHVHSGEPLSVTGNHVHDPGPNQYLITQPTPQVHAIQAFNGGGGPGNVQVTFTKGEFMDNNTMDVGGNTGPTGGGQALDIRPKSRLVRWMTRAG